MGWYPCFQPENSEETYAELMGKDIKQALSYRVSALEKLHQYLTSQQWQDNLQCTNVYINVK